MSLVVETSLGNTVQSVYTIGKSNTKEFYAGPGLQEKSTLVPCLREVSNIRLENSEYKIKISL